MIIEVARIPAEGKKYAGEEPESSLEIDNEADIKAEGPIRYELTAQAVSNRLIVTGKLRARMTFRCSRCAVAFQRDVSDPAVQFVHELADRSESVELTPDIREAILLAFPSHPVCREDCKGLCAQCGADLNQGPCGCVQPKDRRWNALDGLRIK
jgi:uncharacterized protein